MAKVAADLRAVRSAPLAGGQGDDPRGVENLARRGPPDTWPLLKGGELGWPTAEMSVPVAAAALVPSGRAPVKRVAL
jgi:hypothetical protein